MRDDLLDLRACRAASVMPKAARAARRGRGARSTSPSRPEDPWRRRSRRSRGRTRPSARRPSPGPAAARQGSGRARAASRQPVTAATGSPSRAGRSSASERLGTPGRARLREVLAGVDDEPVQPGRELRLAPELADADDELRERVLCGVACVLRVAQQVQRELLDPRRVALAERCERRSVASLRARHEDRVGQPLVDERAVGTRLMTDWTSLRVARLHGVPTLVRDGPRARERIAAAARQLRPRLPLRVRDASTQRMPPADAPHGAVALAEHQTAGRGRLGRAWVDEPGTGLAFSVVLRPPPPVARWPELTLVAAQRGRRRDRAGGDDQAPERRPGRRPEGCRDPRRGERAGRARDRGQRRRRALARRRLGRPRPARAAGRHPRPARAGLRRLGGTLAAK